MACAGGRGAYFFFAGGLLAASSALPSSPPLRGFFGAVISDRLSPRPSCRGLLRDLWSFHQLFGGGLWSDLSSPFPAAAALPATFFFRLATLLASALAVASFSPATVFADRLLGAGDLDFTDFFGGLCLSPSCHGGAMALATVARRIFRHRFFLHGSAASDNVAVTPFPLLMCPPRMGVGGWVNKAILYPRKRRAVQRDECTPAMDSSRRRGDGSELAVIPFLQRVEQVGGGAARRRIRSARCPLDLDDEPSSSSKR